MLWAAIHGIEYFLNIIKRYRLVKKIAHGINEHHLGLFPRQGFPELMGVAGDLKAVGIIGGPHGLKAVCHPLGIAVEAPGARFRASGNRVPCPPGPLHAVCIHR